MSKNKKKKLRKKMKKNQQLLETQLSEIEGLEVSLTSPPLTARLDGQFGAPPLIEEHIYDRITTELSQHSLEDSDRLDVTQGEVFFSCVDWLGW